MLSVPVYVPGGALNRAGICNVYGDTLLPDRFVAVIGTVKTSAEQEFEKVTPPITRLALHVPLEFPMTPLVRMLPDGVPVSAVAVAKNATTSRVVCAPLDRFQLVVTEIGADMLLLVK